MDFMMWNVAIGVALILEVAAVGLLALRKPRYAIMEKRDCPLFPKDPPEAR